MATLKKCEYISRDAILRLEKQVIDTIRIYISNQGRRSVGEAELEIRLGHINGKGRFVSGITKTAWRKICDTLDAFQGWESIKEWREICDFFWTATDETGKSIQLRTSRYIDDNGQMQFECYQKSKISECTVKIVNIDAITTSARVSFATEIPYSGKLPKIVPTDSVRIKKRKSYYWKGSSSTWAVDVTKVWTDNTLTQTTRKRDLDENKMSDSKHGGDTEFASYEIEIECMDTPLYFKHKGNTNSYIALSLLMKVLGILPKIGNENKQVVIE